MTYLWYIHNIFMIHSWHNYNTFLAYSVHFHEKYIIMILWVNRDNVSILRFSLVFPNQVTQRLQPYSWLLLPFKLLSPPGVGGWWGGWCWGLFSHLSNGTFSTDSVQIYDTCITHSWEIYIKFMTILIFIHDIFMKHLWYKWYILGTFRLLVLLD